MRSILSQHNFYSNKKCFVQTKDLKMSGDQKQVSFSITEPRFDKDTYWGRVQSIAAGVKFTNAFKTKAEIQKMQELLAD